MHTRNRVVASIALALCAAPPHALAMDVSDGRLTVSGFGEWGYGRTGSSNQYFIGSKEGEYGHSAFSLAVIARPTENVVVAGQVFLEHGLRLGVVEESAVSLDWGFAEYRLNDLLRIRAGKVKNPFGLFMEVKDVGTLRPFFALPQTIYGPGDFGAEAYLGAGITGEWSGRAWSVGYDAYGGALELPMFQPNEAIGAGPPFDFTNVLIEERQIRDVIGGRLTLTTPVEGLSFRVSGYTGDLFDAVENAHHRVIVYGLSAEWAIDRFQLRGEIFRQSEGSDETNLAGYVEAAWTFLPKLQVAVRYERAKQDLEGVPDAYASLLRHEEAAIGLAYWPNPDLAFKLSYHRVDGNRLALPTASRDDGSIAHRTDLVVAGAQFAF